MGYFTISSFAAAPARQFYQLIIYHVKDKLQEERVDKYLSAAYLPAAHRAGIPQVGIFKTVNIDTASDKRIYVLLIYRSLKDFHQFSQVIRKDRKLSAEGADYLNAKFDNPPYLRKESILMEAFTGMPVFKKPVFTTTKNEQIFELRSYESATERLYENKVTMFNKDEMEIFTRIGSQPVFYGEVLAGSHMPNLMYMTAYNNKAARDEHWKVFGNDAKWKTISALPEYQHNMSKADVQLLTPATYSDL